MAHKTFISYKYSEARGLRDDIIRALGSDASFYKGETSESPDLTDTSTENIKKRLSDMLFDTTVTIVIISPHIAESKWIPWEIKYCLKEMSREGCTSHRNGLVGVIQSVNGSYDWFVRLIYDFHTNGTVAYFDTGLLPEVLVGCVGNSVPPRTHCARCDLYERDYGNYMSIVRDFEFINNPKYFIEIAYDKANKHIDEYKLPDLINSDPQSV